jgi:hypothetical protein
VKLPSQYRVITNDISDSYQLIYVIAHIFCNHPVHFAVVLESLKVEIKTVVSEMQFKQGLFVVHRKEYIER